MRKTAALFKGIFTAMLAVACGCFLYLLYRSPELPEGEARAYYLGASSSARMETSDSPCDRLFSGMAAGESVRYAGDRYEALKEQFGAKLLFVECAAGVVNYYLYSPFLSRSVTLGGKTVNLHIAVSGEETAAGTPLIFGGF